MSRRQTRIFRNLHYRWTFAGLGIEDIAIITLPASVMIAPVAVLGLSISWVVMLAAATAVALIILKRNRPPGFIEAQIAIFTTPARFSHKVRDSGVRPFPLEPKVLAPSSTQKKTVSLETVSRRP